MLVNLYVQVKQLNLMSATPVVLVNSLNHSMLVKLFVPIIQLVLVVLVNSSNHQLLVNLSFPIMSVMSITSAVLVNSSKHLMLLNLSVPVMQVILSFVIPLVSLFLIFSLFSVSDCQSVKPARKLIDVNRFAVNLFM